MKTIEYRVEAVTRFVLTRVSSIDHSSLVPLRELVGEFDSQNAARKTACALASVDQYGAQDLDGLVQDDTDGGFRHLFTIPSKLTEPELRDIENHIRGGYGAALGTRPSSPEDDFPLTIARDRDPGDETATRDERIARERDDWLVD